jgi:hypothetical protein
MSIEFQRKRLDKTELNCGNMVMTKAREIPLRFTGVFFFDQDGLGWI